MNEFIYLWINEKKQVIFAILPKKKRERGKHGKEQILNWEIKNNLLSTQWILHLSVWFKATYRNVIRNIIEYLNLLKGLLIITS